MLFPCPLSKKADLEDRKREVSGISLIPIAETLWSLHCKAVELLSGVV